MFAEMKIRRLFCLLLCLALLSASLCACGKRAEPEPPSLVVPVAISDLHLYAKPGQRYLVWSLPSRNTDGSKPADLIAFRIYKKVSDVDATCLYCDEGFKELITINIMHPEIGFVRADNFYYPAPYLTDGEVDVFYVVSVNSRGWTSPLGNKLKVFYIPPIGPPKDVKCQPSLSVVEIDWSEVQLPLNTGQIYYNVYRRSSNKPGFKWRRLTPDPLESNSYIDVGLIDWRAYEYAVTTLLSVSGQYLESGYSRPQKIIPGDYTPPSPVADFVAFPYLAGVQLVWSAAHDSDLAGYEIFKLDMTSGLKENWIVPPSMTNFFDRRIDRSHSYRYYILSFDRSKRRNRSKPSKSVVVSFD
jgi:hypothetical protein